MSSLRTILSAALAWLVVVAVGSTVVWAVISRAGEGIAPTAGPQVGSSVPASTSAPRVIRAPTLSPADGSAGPTGSASHPDSPDSPGSPSTSTPHTAPAGPPTSGTSPHANPTNPSAPSSPGSSHPTSSHHPSPTAQPTPTTRRTWQGPGGVVTVECRGAAISLVGTSADAGFSVEVGSRGPEEVEVTFEGQGEEGRETQVKATCVGGVPEFEVEASDD